MKINQNLMALNAFNKLNKNEKASASSLQKLSTGLRINRAADDVAGLGISQKMKAQIRGLQRAERNIQDGISLIQTAEGGLSQIENPILQRIRELAIKGANDTLSPEDRKAIQAEIDQLKQSINDIANNTHFNGINLLNVPGTTTTVPIPSDSNETTINGKADIVFIIDKTGSMGSSINNVVENLEEFASSIESNGINSRFGLVTYGDVNPSDGGDLVISTPFTGNIIDFKTSISSITVNGGGDFAESGLEGINEALKNYPLRPGASKQFILLTDALVHDDATDMDGGDGKSTHDIDVMAITMGYQNIKFTVVGPISNQTVNTQLKRLSEPTGGKYLDIYGDFSAQLQDLSRSIVEDSISENEYIVQDLKLQVGANSGDIFEMDLTDARTTALGIDDIKVDPWEEAEKAITKLDESIEMVSSERVKYGSYQNRLEHALNNVSNASFNHTVANSRIEDVDMAKEMIELTKNDILTQASQAILAQANQQHSTVLQLLKP
jgi:flagellin